MTGQVSCILKSGLLGVAAVALTVIALLVLPAFAAFMVIWMHAALSEVAVTVGPLVAIFGIGAVACIRASRRACGGP